MVQVGDTVLAIVKIIMREVWGVGDDEDAGSVMPRIAGWAADAILAAGLLDRTGALLTRAAELGIHPTLYYLLRICQSTSSD